MTFGYFLAGTAVKNITIKFIFVWLSQYVQCDEIAHPLLGWIVCWLVVREVC